MDKFIDSFSLDHLFHIQPVSHYLGYYKFGENSGRNIDQYPRVTREFQILQLCGRL
jgi:hypothetical protein